MILPICCCPCATISHACAFEMVIKLSRAPPLQYQGDPLHGHAHRASKIMGKLVIEY